MAQIPFRANLQTMFFPLLSDLSGRTIIVPQADQTYIPNVSAEGQSPVDRGNPQIFYCHNVMPSTTGWQSVGFNLAYSPPDAGVDLDFERAQIVYGGKIVSETIEGVVTPVVKSTGFKTYLAHVKAGVSGVYVLDIATLKWKLVSGSPSIPANCPVSVATVNGVSYIYFSNIGCYIYNNETNSLVERVLAGLNKTTTIGLASANGYLFAWNASGVAWSSTVNVEDFVPTDVSGAGGGQLQEARGEIVTAVATYLGLIIYTKENAVSVIYSGNAEFPWNFKAIPSSGGISSAELVSQEQASGYQQVYSTNGIQQVTHSRCQTVLPNITDFLAGNIFEDFDTATNTFSITKFTWNMRKKLAVIADRYIVISYGVSPTADMTHAIVLDIAQNRMGKIKLTHTSCFELRSLNSAVTELPRDSIAFLQRDGTIKLVDFSLLEATSDSVLIMGKFQYVRQKMLELHRVEVENTEAADSFSVQDLPTLNGKTFLPSKPGYLYESSGNYRDYLWEDAVGKNHTLVFKGTFNLISLIIWFSLTGQG